ncbi:cytochrome P450 [Zopfochytrium polystomum]|nr:cytochrome P450 [Zopfochytrium polystomum]
MQSAQKLAGSVARTLSSMPPSALTAAAAASVVSAVAIFLTYLYQDDPVFQHPPLKKQPLTDPSTIKGHAPTVGRSKQTLPFIGDTLYMAANFHRIHDFFTEHLNENARECSERGVRPVGVVMKLPFSPAVISNVDPAVVEHVLKTKFPIYNKSWDRVTIFSRTSDVLGHGIFAVDGEEWKFQRKTAANIFNIKNFKEFVGVVFVEEMAALSLRLDQAAQTSEVVNLQDLFFRFTLDSFCRIGFGEMIDSLKQEKPIAFATAFDAAQTRLSERFLTPLWRLAEFLSVEGRRHQRNVRLIKDFGRKIVEKRLAHLAAGGDPSEFSDVLSFMMSTEVPQTGLPPTPDQLTEYVINLIIAGRDTTAQALSCTARRIDAALPERGQLPSYEQVRGMQYANAVFHETLRLYPSVPMEIKEAAEDDVLPSGHVDLGEDAARFRPERWLEMEKAPSPYAYPVFNAGPRVCLGKNMAEVEGVFVLVSLMKRFEIEVIEHEKLPHQLNFQPSQPPHQLLPPSREQPSLPPPPPPLPLPPPPMQQHQNRHHSQVQAEGLQDTYNSGSSSSSATDAASNTKRLVIHPGASPLTRSASFPDHTNTPYIPMYSPAFSPVPDLSHRFSTFAPHSPWTPVAAHSMLLQPAILSPSIHSHFSPIQDNGPLASPYVHEVPASSQHAPYAPHLTLWEDVGYSPMLNPHLGYITMAPPAAVTTVGPSTDITAAAASAVDPFNRVDFDAMAGDTAAEAADTFKSIGGDTGQLTNFLDTLLGDGDGRLVGAASSSAAAAAAAVDAFGDALEVTTGAEPWRVSSSSTTSASEPLHQDSEYDGDGDDVKDEAPDDAQKPSTTSKQPKPKSTTNPPRKRIRPSRRVTTRPYNEGPHQCQICQRRFMQPPSLRAHMKLHRKKRQHACTFEGCGKVFLRAQDLSRHGATHRDAEDRPSSARWGAGGGLEEGRRAEAFGAELRGEEGERVGGGGGGQRCGAGRWRWRLVYSR